MISLSPLSLASPAVSADLRRPATHQNSRSRVKGELGLRGASERSVPVLPTAVDPALSHRGTSPGITAVGSPS